MGLLSTLAAHDFGFIDVDQLIQRLDDTLTAIDALEKHEGHLLNWYNTVSRAPLLPRYVSTVDSGNLSGALITIASGLTQLCQALARDEANTARCARVTTLVGRADALVAAMDFTFLYDNDRRLFAIGYRLADADGPGRRFRLSRRRPSRVRGARWKRCSCPPPSSRSARSATRPSCWH